MNAGLSHAASAPLFAAPAWSRTATRAPLGLDQERLWLVDQLNPLSNTYNISFGLHIRGAFAVEHLATALAEVVARHEVLRSIVVPDEAGRPQVHILPSVEIPIRSVDLRSVDARRRDFARRAEMDLHVQQPFDLGVAPLMRILVIRDQDDSHYVVETSHHSVIDRWSYVRFNQELLGFYRRSAFGVPYTPPGLPLQFFDFAVRQRQRLEQNRDEIRNFWRDYLADAPTRNTLPYDYPQPSTDRTGGHCNFVVDDAVAHGLIRYARKNRMTLNSALIGAYAAVLHEQTGNRDIVIGFPSVVRNDPELSNIIGFLLTNIPIRVRIPDDPTLAGIVREVRNATADVSGFGDTPYSEIIAAIAPKRVADEYPLIQTMASSLEFEEELFDYEAGEISIIEVMDGVSPNDLTLGFWKSGERLQGTFAEEGLHGRLEYRTVLFHPRTIERLVGRLLGFLADLAEERADRPVRPVDERVVPRPVGEEVRGGPRSDSSSASPDAERRRQVLAEAWNGVLGTSGVHASDDFFEQGGNSLLAVRLGRALRQSGYGLPVREIFAHTTFGAMVDLLRPLVADGTRTAPPQAHAPATPEQLRFLEADLGRPERWAHTLILDGAAGIDADRMRQALATVVSAHRALTATIERTPSGWRMNAGDSWLWREEDGAASDAEIAGRHLDRLDLAGPLFCATWARAPAPRLVLTASHLIIDGLSWTILDQEIAAAYRGDAIAPEGRDYLDYAATLARLPFGDQLPFWREQVAAIRPLSGTRAVPDLMSAEQVSKRLLHAPIGASQGQAEAVAAIAGALAPWQESVVVDVVGTGRESLPGLDGWDPARAVGNYACLFPLHLPVAGRSLEDDSHAVRATLNAVPFGGKGYGALRFRTDSLPAAGPPVSVNYTGRLTTLSSTQDSPFLARRDLATCETPDARRAHHLNIDVGWHSDGLELTWRTNPDVLPDEQTERIVAAAGTHLLALAERPEIRSRGGRLAMPQTAVNEHFAMLCARSRSARRRVRSGPAGA